MPIVYVSTTFDQPVDEVWAVLGDFHAIDSWAETIHESNPEYAVDRAPAIGSVRRLTIGRSRQTVRERLIAYDIRARQMSYELTDHPLPFGMTDYLSTVHALPITETGKAFVEWYGQYECANSDDVVAIEAGLGGSYRHLLGDLRNYLDGARISST